MNYFKFGQGKNTLLILPGLSVQSVMPLTDTIKKSYEIFEKDFTVYLFDRRADLPEKYSVYDIAEDTFKAVCALSLKDICVFGASQGGMAAMVLACMHPELCKSVVLGNTSPYIDQSNSAVLNEWIDCARRGDSCGLALGFARKVYPADIFDKYRGVFETSAEDYSAEDLKRFTVLSEGTLGFDIRVSLSSVRCPVLAIGSSDDNVLGSEGTYEIGRILGLRSDFEMYLYDGFGHAAFDTAPDYKERMYEFFMKNI